MINVYSDIITKYLVLLQCKFLLTVSLLYKLSLCKFMASCQDVHTDKPHPRFWLYLGTAYPPVFTVIDSTD